MKPLHDAAAIISFSVFSLAGLFALSTLHLTLTDLLNINSLTSINPIMLILSLALTGIALGMLFALTHGEEKAIAALTAFAAGLTGVIPATLFFTDQALLFILLAIAYCAGLSIAAWGAAGTEKKGFLDNASTGNKAAGRTFLVLSIASFLIITLLVGASPHSYNKAMKDGLKDFVRTSGTTSMSRDQLRALAQAQSSSITQDQVKSMLEAQVMAQDFSVSRTQIRIIYEPLYTQLEQQLTEQELDTLYNQINTPENIEAMRAEALSNVDQQAQAYYQQVQSGNAAQIDEAVERMYQALNSAESQETLMSSVDTLVETMPFFQQIMDWIHVITAFAFASAILLAKSLVIGPVAALTAGIVITAMPEQS